MDPNADSSLPSIEERTDSLAEKMLRPRRVPRFAMLESMMRILSPGERLLLYCLTIVLGVSALILLAKTNAAVSVSVPSYGGSITEGEVGPARFVNPVLTMSRADEDLTQLVYSGLTRTLPNGTVVPDLASKFDISPDGTIYTFTLRPDVKFHDGTALTSADVLFTVQRAQDPNMKSSHRADWEGVAVETPDPDTVIFKLPHAYAPFIQNTGMGILPKHLWENTSAEEFPFSPVNTHPIGSGPYRVADMGTDSTGSVTRFDLVPFSSFTLGSAHLGRITFLFYPNEEAMLRAFGQGRIDAMAGISPEQLSQVKRTDTRALTVPLPRIFGVFFNQAHATILADSAARNALNAALDKQALVDLVLGGYGVPLDGPIPPGIIEPAPARTSARSASTTVYTDDSITKARSILTKGGWVYDANNNVWKNKKKQTLTFALTTADSPELVKTANAVAAAWQTLGVPVTVQIYSLSELNSTVIRPRNYDAVLFGEVVGHELDLFAFWHSSQRNDPGLNLSLYASSQADTLLTKARATTNATDRNKLYTQFAALISKDMPAIFLYSPEFIYEVPGRLSGVQLGAVTMPAERFANVYEWYTDTERVWSIFAKDEGTQ